MGTIAQKLQHTLDCKQAIKEKLREYDILVPDRLERVPDAIDFSEGKLDGIAKFMDYDGSVLYMYNAEEFMALQSLPPQPVHNIFFHRGDIDRRLTNEGWNMSLQEAKTLFQQQGYVVVGCFYDINYTNVNSPVFASLEITVEKDEDRKVFLRLTDTILMNNYWAPIALDEESATNVYPTNHGSQTTSNYARFMLPVTDYPRKYIILVKHQGTQKLIHLKTIETEAKINYIAYNKQYLKDGKTMIPLCYSNNRIRGLFMPNTDIVAAGYSSASPDYKSTEFSFSVPASTTSVPPGFFAGNAHIKSDNFSMHDNITSIGEQSFYECANIKRMYLPNVTDIEKNAFEYCTSLERVDAPNVSTIASGAFRHCNSLSSFDFHANIDTIGNYAFSDTGFVDLDISVLTASNVTGNFAFSQCANLETVVATGTTPLGFGYFADCPNLKSVTLGQSMTDIPQYCFRGCSSLKSISLSSVENIGSRAFVSAGLTGVNIPEKTQLDGTATFLYNQNLQTVDMGQATAISAIPASSFANCTYLANITFPDNVKEIGQLAFGRTYMVGVAAISDITIPSSVTAISASAFCNFSQGSSFSILNPNINIGSYVFSGCSGVKNIVFPGKYAVNSYYGFYGNAKNIENITVTPGTTNLVSYYCSACSSLTSISIPNSVSSIGEYTFYGCSSIPSIELPSAVKTVPSYMCYNCTSLKNIDISHVSGTLGNYSFGYCHSLSALDVPNAVTSFGTSAFVGCSSVERVTVSDGISTVTNYPECAEYAVHSGSTVWSTSDGVLYNAAGTTLQRFPVKKTGSFTVPSNVTTLATQAFSYCSGLTSLTVPNTVTTFNTYNFRGCTGLTSFTIPTSLTATKTGMFFGCTGLTSLTFPSTLMTIAATTFSGCSNILLFDFRNHTSVPTLSNVTAFANTNANKKIVVPDALYNSWIAASNWSSTTNNIKASIIKASDYSP